MMASYTVDDIVNIIFAILVVGYSLLTILGGIFSSKRKVPRQVEEDEEDEEQEHLPQHLPPLPPRPVVAIKKAPSAPPEDKFEFHSSLENFQQKSAIEEQKLTIHLHSSDELVSESLRMLYSEGTVYKKKSNQTISQLVKTLPEKKLLFLSYEVFHQPVSRRESPFPWNK